MSQVIDDATSAMNDAIDDASTLLNKTIPLGEFLDEQLAKAKELENAETDENYDSPIRTSCPRIEIPMVSEGYVMDGEIAREFLACSDRDDVKKLLSKLKEKSLMEKMKYDPKFATSHIFIFVTDRDYEFSVDPELITYDTSN